MKKVKVLFIDDIESSYNDFKLIEGLDISNKEIVFEIINRQSHFDIDSENQIENIEEEIDWSIKNGVEILILDIYLTHDEHDNKQIPNDISTFSSVLLEEKYYESIKLIIFTSSSDIEAVSDFEDMKRKYPVLFKERWKFIPKIIIDYPDIPIEELCPRLCGDESKYNPSPPCTSVECIYWQLVYHYKIVEDMEKK
jgi:hypothetical protein